MVREGLEEYIPSGRTCKRESHACSALSPSTPDEPSLSTHALFTSMRTRTCSTVYRPSYRYPSAGAYSECSLYPRMTRTGFLVSHDFCIGPGAR